MKRSVLFLIILCSMHLLKGQNAWINELHYDDSGGDANEVVEIVIEHPGNHNLADFSVYLYNGNDGTTYGNESVNDFTVGDTEGDFTIYYWLKSGIQNGAPDGLALVYQGTVISGQFLSYEGVFTASDGPANGLTSSDIGVAESGSTLDTESLQLAGSGTQYADFTWQPPDQHTRGSLNNNQTLGNAGIENPSNFLAVTGGTDQVDVSWIQNADVDDVMIAFNTSDIFGSPVDGTPYFVDDPISGGGTVIYNGGATSTTHLGLTSDTRYFYKAWSVDASVNYSSGVATDTTTLAEEPLTDPTLFAATVLSSTEIAVSWIDGTRTPGNYLVKASDISFADVVHPLDGASEQDDLLVKNIAAGVQTSLFTGLTPSTTYYFKIFSYNGDNGSVNYKNDNPQQTQATTDDPTGVSSGDIIISEVMQNPAYASDGSGEWFEVFNTTGTAIDLNGWTLTDNGSNSHTISGSLLVSPGGFAVLGNNEEATTNGGVPVDYEYSSFTLGNGSDAIILTSDASLEIDRIEWDDGTSWPDPNGKSMTYTGLPTDDNNDGSKWIQAVERENLYTNPNTDEDDLGSPGTNGLFQNLISATSWTGTGTWSGGNGVGASNWSSGSPGSSVDVTVNGTGSVTVDLPPGMPAVCDDLSLLSDASLDIASGAALTVRGDLEIAAGNGLRAAATFTVESDTEGNGSVIVNGMVTGEALFSRFFDAYTNNLSRDGWHLIGTPVSDMVITGTGFDTKGTANDLYKYDEIPNLWVNYKEGSFPDDKFENGRGYLAAFETEGTRDFIGVFNDADIVHTDLSLTPVGGDGWHLLGNPFPSALEWNNGDWTLVDVSGIAHVWDETSMDYVELDPFDGVPDIIPATNGFFVKAESAGADLTIPRAARLHDDTPNYKKALNTNSLTETLIIKVTTDFDTYCDETKIGFRADATEERDIAFDGHKLFGAEEIPQIWTVTNGESYSINRLPFVYESYQVPMHFKAGTAGLHYLSFEGLDSFYDNSDIYLEDLLAEALINLREQQMYTFSATTEDPEYRFVLHFSGVTRIESSFDQSDLQVYAANRSIFIRSVDPATDQYSVTIFNAMGQQVASIKLGHQALHQVRITEKPGVYVVRLQSANGIIVQKVLIN